MEDVTGSRRWVVEVKEDTRPLSCWLTACHDAMMHRQLPSAKR